MNSTLHVRRLNQQAYTQTWQAMREFTDARTADTPDELWLVEHPPVFTLGQAGKPEHILNAHNIPVINTDRGGQVTYHGPGQIVIYLLIDLRRREQGIRNLVRDIEQAIIDFLALYNIPGEIKSGAPGVYVADKKIASIGLRVRRGCTYHGISFNLDMDLTPFSYINPCGYPGLVVTQFADLVPNYQRQMIEEQLITCLAKQLSYNKI
jgi:lipoyl(octanoyl) transferase